MLMGTPERWGLNHAHQDIKQLHGKVDEILLTMKADKEERKADKEKREKADEERAKTKKAKEERKAKERKAKEDTDKENMKQLSNALLQLPLRLNASAAHLELSSKELKLAADIAEAAIKIALPVLPSSAGPPSSAGSSSAAGPSSSAGSA
jgi:type II secretory ATPase GspE/PulE/Tfp pilus assembly ATPase PilB-like protein